MNWFSSLIFSIALTLISSTVFAKKSDVLKQYEQLTSIEHLNSDENIKLLSDIIIQIKAPTFNTQRAPFYAYAAKLNANNGNFSKANQLLEEAIKTLPQLQDNDLLIDTLDNLSRIYLNQGNYVEAISYLQQMTNNALLSKNMRGRALALARLGLSYLELNVNELAIPPLKLALDIARKNNNKNVEYLALLYLVNARTNDPYMSPKESMDLLNKATEISLLLNVNDGFLTRLKGIVYQQLGDNVKAKHWLQKSLSIAKSHNDIRLQRIVHKNLAQFYLAKKEILQAKVHALISFELANKLKHKKSMANLHLILSDIYNLENNKEKTLHHLSHYANFIASNSTQNIIALLTIMNKSFDNIEQREKIISLEKSALENQLIAEKRHNEQYSRFIVILVIAFAFIVLTIIYFIKTRILSMKVALSMKDTLTGAFGRSYLEHYLPGVKARFAQDLNIKKSFGVIAIDCDDFKLINEKFGHAGGDKALKYIVSSLMKQIRPGDHLFRWGGDEFILMCENVSQQQLSYIAQRLLESVSCLTIKYDDKIIKTTISVGYALHKKGIDFNLGRLLKEADKYLYQTKNSGKNNFIGSYI